MEYFDAFEEVFERLLSTGLEENDVLVLLAQLMTDWEEDLKLIRTLDYLN